MNVSGKKFQSLYALVCKSSARSNHRTTLPQSRPLGVTAPSEREPGMGAYHSSDHSEAATLRAIFIAPTKLRIFHRSKNFRFLTQKRYRVGQGTYRIGTRPVRN